MLAPQNPDEDAVLDILQGKVSFHDFQALSFFPSPTINQ